MNIGLVPATSPTQPAIQGSAGIELLPASPLELHPKTLVFPDPWATTAGDVHVFVDAPPSQSAADGMVMLRPMTPVQTNPWVSY